MGTFWFLAALLVTPVVAAGTLLAEKSLGMSTASLRLMTATLPIAVIWPLFAALGEEFGWRGFLLPQLQKKYSAFTSSIVVGVSWGLWHVPTVVLSHRQFGVAVVFAYVLLVHVIAITAQSTMMTWIYNNTRQSLLLMIVFHFSLTGSAIFFFPLNLSVTQGLQHQFVYGVLYWLAAGLVVFAFRSSPSPS